MEKLKQKKFTDADYEEFIKIKFNLETIGKYEKDYLNKNLNFSSIELELYFLYALSLHFRTIIYSDLKQLKNAVFVKDELYYKPIYYSFRAIHLASTINNFSDKNELLQRIYTNLGNYYSDQFRVLEALEAYGNALLINRNFEQARFCKLLCLEKIEGIKHYSKDIFKLFYYVCDEYSLINSNNLESGKDRLIKKQAYYKDLYKKYFHHMLKNKIVSIKSYLFSMPLSNDDLLDWLQINKLYINPLTDIEDFREEFRDVLLAQSLSQEQIDLFKEIIDEFVLLREKIFINRRLENKIMKREFIHNFKSLFSLFDKIGFLIYKVFDLEIRSEDVSFLKIFSDRIKTKNGVKFSEILNVNIYALNWIKREYRIEDTKIDMNKYMTQDSQGIAKFRNLFEHTIISIEEIDDNDLYSKCIKLAQVIRNAIIYTNLLVYQENVTALYDKNGVRNINLSLFSSNENLFDVEDFEAGENLFVKM